MVTSQTHAASISSDCFSDDGTALANSAPYMVQYYINTNTSTRQDIPFRRGPSRLLVLLPLSLYLPPPLPRPPSPLALSRARSSFSPRRSHTLLGRSSLAEAFLRARCDVQLHRRTPSISSSGDDTDSVSWLPDVCPRPYCP